MFRITNRASERAARTALGRRITEFLAELRQRRVPLHWTNMFGVVSIACLLVLFGTGAILTLFYSPSSSHVVYHGGYVPLKGISMSRSFESTLTISLEQSGGLLVRQAHHWAGLLLPASIILQLLTSFFTGAFRKPRRVGWVLLFLLLITALVGGWSGYALPDDMLSGTGLRIVEGIVLGIPFIGTWLSSLLFGGEFPGHIIAHLYPIHVIAVPIAIVVVLVVRIRAGYRQKPAQFPGPGRAENNVVGIALWPNAATRAGGLVLIVIGLLFLISALFTISPIWLSGPSSPSDASAGSQPDWYTGFLDGALRLVPPGREFVWLGHTWTLALLVPLAVIGVFLVAVVFYPFIEQWISGDNRDHHLLDRPRNTPSRTATGAAGIVLYGALWGAGSADVVAAQFQLSFESVISFYRVLVLIGPVAAFTVTRRVCLALQKKDRDVLLHGYETGRIVRLPGGEYVEVHSQVDAYERSRLVNTSQSTPFQPDPDEHGRLSIVRRARRGLSRAFYTDSALPDPAQIENPTNFDQVEAVIEPVTERRS